MTESASSSEFMLGLEEYLKSLDEPAAASQLHTISRSLQAEDPQLAIARSYLQQLTARLPPELVALADLDHSMAKLTQADDAVYRTVLTHCARVLKNKGQELALLADLDHSITKSQLPQDVYRAVLLYNTNFIKSRLDGGTGLELDILVGLADLCHSTRTTSQVKDCYRAVLH